MGATTYGDRVAGKGGQEFGSRRGYLRGKRRHSHGSGAKVRPQREERWRELRHEEFVEDAEAKVAVTRVPSDTTIKKQKLPPLLRQSSPAMQAWSFTGVPTT